MGDVWRALPWALCLQASVLSSIWIVLSVVPQTIRLLSSYKEQLAQLMPKKSLLDIYNLTVKLCLSIVVV